MSFADSINGFKKAYTTEYRDNNNCPYDETVENSDKNSQELINFSTYKESAIFNYTNSSAVSSFSKDLEDDNKEDFSEVTDYEEEKDLEDIENYHIDEVKEEKDDYLGFES